jgi:hypothetical protein
MKSNNNNDDDEDDNDDDDDIDNNNNNNNNNNTAMGSVHARGDTFLTFGLKALTETNTSRLSTGKHSCIVLIEKAVDGDVCPMLHPLHWFVVNETDNNIISRAVRHAAF